jgi:PAS domain S-box-containing protein
MANALLIAGFTQIAYFAFISSGKNLGAVYSIAVIPLCAMLLAGWRTGLVYTLMACGVAVGSTFVPEGALAFLSFGPSVDPTLGSGRDAVYTIIGIGIFAGLYDWTRQSALDETKAARDRSAESERRAVEVSRQLSAMVEVARRLQTREQGDLDAEVEACLRLAAGLVGADRSVLTLFAPGWDRMLARYQWHGAGVPESTYDWSRPARGFANFRWIARQLQRDGTLVVRDLDELPPEAATERSDMQSRGVVGWISMRLRAGRWANGFLTVECHAEVREWSEQELTSLRLLGEILASTVAHRRAEAALRESEEKFSRAFASQPDGLVISRLEDDVIIECNDGFVRSSGHGSREDAIGTCLTGLGSMLDQGSLDLLRAQLDRSGSVEEFEIEIPNHSIETRTLLVTSRRIEIDGTPCALTIFRDVTAHKQLELELRQAQKMEAVGRLAGGIAHDFNNMLTVIAGYGEVLLESVDDDLKQDVEYICDAARRSAGLTRQLLAFSRRQVLTPKVLDLAKLLTSQEPMLRPLIGEDISVQYEIASGVGPIKADPGQIEQAIMNLVINARDAMPNGGNLTFMVRNADLCDADDAAPLGLRPGAYVCLSVTDDGRGMPKEMVARVLEPFFTTKDEGQGTGLGLATVHGITLQSGGNVAIKSEPGKGTTVELYLPAASGRMSIEEPGNMPVPSVVARGTILIVEDEDTVRQLARRALEAVGYRVIEATDGVNALQVAEQYGDSIDLLLTDVVMPRMGGVELADALRQVRAELRVAFMSGYPARNGEAEHALPPDVPLIAKPFQPSELCAQVAGLLDAPAT